MEAISKKSLAFMGLYIYLFLIIVNLPLKDIALILLIDTTSFYILGISLDKLFFNHFFPNHSKVIKLFTSKEIENIKKEKQFLKVLYQVPFIRSLFTIPLNILKILPAGIFFVYYADNNLTINEGWVVFWCMEIFMMTIFSAITYIELHSFITNEISKLHTSHNLSAMFEKFNVPRSVSTIKNFESFALLASAVILVIQTGCLSTTNGFTRQINLAIPLLAGTILISRIYYLYRNYFYTALNRVFVNINELGGSQTSIPISSSSAVSGFEEIFNRLSKDISTRDEEISNWLMNEAESSRYRTIGEVSARIGHDIKGPIHALKHFSKKLSESNSGVLDIKPIVENISRIEELTNNLNSNLRNPDKSETSSLFEVHFEVLKGLRLDNFDIDQVNFNLKGIEKLPNIDMARADLVHILYNLNKNSLRNMFSNNIKPMIIRYELLEMSAELTKIIISDNGTGLSKDEFDQLTAGVLDKKVGSERFKRGLGLRLVKKLIKNNGGDIEIYSDNNPGTSFLIKLPLSRDINSIPTITQNIESHYWMN